MLDAIKDVFGPYYLYLKFVHLLCVMIWAWSTAVAYVWYVRIAWDEWQQDPCNDYLLARRNWVYEQFDRGVVLEHIAFPIILITGPLLYIAGGWNLNADWLLYKLLIVIGLFMPIEIFDYWISHLGGNKKRNKNDCKIYEQRMVLHNKFLLFISPIVVVSILSVLFLAVVKPDF